MFTFCLLSFCPQSCSHECQKWSCHSVHLFFAPVLSTELYPCMPEAEKEKEAEPEEPEFRISLYDLANTNEKAKQVIKRRLRRKKTRVKKMTRNNVLKRSLGKVKDSCTCCTWEGVHSFLKRMFPFLSILKGYSALYDLPCDIIAGLTVGIMHIPQGKRKRRVSGVGGGGGGIQLVACFCG